MRPTIIRIQIALCILFLFGLPPQLAAAVNRWTTGGPDGGLITALAIAPTNPDILYAGVRLQGGVFRSIDGGANWTAVNSGLPTGSHREVSSLAVDPTDPLTVYVGVLPGIFVSHDGGDTWKQTAPGPIFAKSILIDPADHNTIYAGTLNALFRSFDGGMSWQVVYDHYIGLDYADDIVLGWGTIYVPTSGGIVHRSTDRGTTWSTVSTLPPGAYKIVVDPIKVNTAYAYRNDGVLFETSDGGVSWNHKGAFIDPGTLYIDPRSDVFYLNTNTGLFRSTDFGSTWSLVSKELVNMGFVSYAPLAFNPRREGCFYVWFKNIAKTTDGGFSWTDATHGLINTTIWTVAIDPTNPSRVYVDANKSSDGGLTWTRVRYPGTPNTANEIAIDPSNPSTVYAAAGNVFKSTDGGETWTVSASGADFNTLAIDPLTPSTIYAGAYWNGIFKSTDSGASWIHLPLDPEAGLPGVGPIQQIAVSPSRPRTVYAAGGYVTIRSDDGGTSWTAAGIGASRLAIDPVDPQIVYMITNFGNQLLRTTNGGQSWAEFGPPGDYRSVATDPHAANVVYFGSATIYLQLASKGNVASQTSPDDPGDEIVYRSKDAGRTWIALSNVLAGSTSITALAVAPSDPSIVYAGTASNGLHSIKLVPLAGDANEDFTVTVADVFYLINYLFAAGSPPSPTADANGDGIVNAADIFFLINYLFAGGAAPQ